MSAIFFKNFLRRPLQVASIVPSSRKLVDRVARRFDFSQPRRIVELGAGEGVHSRELAKRMHPDSRLMLLELNADLAASLREEFQDDERVEVVEADAATLPAILAEHGWEDCDYVLSGIPFSIMPKETKQELIRAVHGALAPKAHAAFVTYQVTAELRDHATMFHREQSEYCVRNVPPMFVNSFHKLPEAPVPGAPV